MARAAYEFFDGLKHRVFLQLGVCDVPEGFRVASDGHVLGSLMDRTIILYINRWFGIDSLLDWLRRGWSAAIAPLAFLAVVLMCGLQRSPLSSISPNIWRCLFKGL